MGHLYHGYVIESQNPKLGLWGSPHGPGGRHHYVYRPLLHVPDSKIGPMASWCFPKEIQTDRRQDDMALINTWLWYMDNLGYVIYI